MVNDIVNRTGTALSLSAEEIAAMVISGDEQGAQQLINSIVQSEVLMQLERKFGDLSISITADMAASLKSLDATLKEFSIDRDFIQNICDSIQKILSFWDAGAKDSGKGGCRMSRVRPGVQRVRRPCQALLRYSMAVAMTYSWSSGVSP